MGEIEVRRPPDQPDLFLRPYSALSEEDASTMFLDIRNVVIRCGTDDDVVQSLRSLSVSEKYAYLHRHVKPQEGFTFPTTFTGGCNRSFQARWLDEHPWLMQLHHKAGWCILHYLCAI